MKRLVAGLIGVLAIAGFTPAGADEPYPTRSITMIVPFAPGGPADVLARLVGQKMSEDLGQQIIVDNRPGANTILGAQAAAKAKPDGYTILLAIDGTLVMNQFLYSKLAYDPVRDFEPVAQIADVPSALIANLKNPANTLKEVIDMEKARPGSFQVGVSTPTSQVATGLLNMMAGTNFVMVQYGGGNTQITGLMAGDIALGHESVNVSLPLYKDKQIKMIALTGKKRLSLAPEIPTFAEMFPGFDMGIWQSVVVPAGTPKPIIDRLYQSLAKAMAAQDLRDKLLAAGLEPTISKSPEDFKAFIAAQSEVRSKVIKAIGMKLD